MSLYGAKQLAESMATVRKNTLAIAADIPAESYDYRPTPDSRSVAETLFHIVAVWRFAHHIHEAEPRSSLADFDFAGYFAKAEHDEKRVRSKEEIIEALRVDGERYFNWVAALPEARLAESVGMPQGQQPAEKSRLEMLIGAKEHEMHHRAQLMVMQRLLGIVPHLTRNRQQAAAEAFRARS